MALSVSELEARLRVESSQFTKGLGDAQKSVNEFKKEVTSASDAMKKELAPAADASSDSLAKAVKGWDEWVAGMRAGLAETKAKADQLATGSNAVTGAFGSWRSAALGVLASLSLVAGAATLVSAGANTVTQAMTEQLQRGRELQAATGLQAQQAVALGNTFEAVGLNGSVLTAAMGRIREEAAKGGELLKFMGISARDAGGQLKAEGDTFLEVHGRVQQYTSATERAQAVTDLFGTELGRRLAPFFDLSRERLTALLTEMGALGPQTEENRRASEAYIESTTKLGVAWEALKTRYGPAVLDTLSAIITKLIDVTRRSDEARESMRKLPPPTSEIGTAPGDARVRALMRGETTNTGAVSTADLDRVDAALSRIAARLNELSPGQTLAIQKIRQELDLIGKSPADSAIARLKAQFDAIADPRIKDAVKANYDAAFSAIRAKEAEAQLKAAAAAFKPLETALATLQSNVAALDLTPTEAEFRKLVQPVEQAIAALERSGQITPTVAAEYRSAAAAAAQVAIDHKLANEELKKFVALLNSDITSKMQGVTQGFDHQADAMRRAAEELAELTDMDDRIVASGNAATKAGSQIEGQYTKALDEAKAKLAAVKAELGSSREQIELNNVAWQLGKTTFDRLNPTLQETARQIAAVNLRTADTTGANQYQRALADIDAQARVLGPSFDALSARIRVTQAELARLANESRGVTTPAIADLQAQLANDVEIQRARDLYADLFGSIQGGIGKVIEGLQLGTRGWEGFGETALTVLRSIAAEIINRLLRAALDPLTARLAALASGAVTGSPSQAAINAANSINSPVNDDSAAGGGGGATLPSIPTGIFDSSVWSSISGLATGLWGAMGGAGGALGPAFTGVTAVDIGLAGGSLSDIGAAASAATQGVSGFTVALAGVGAALAVFGTIMDFVNGNIGAGVGGVVGGTVGAVAGGLVGTYVFPGVGTVLGALAGGAIGDWLGSMLGGLFGGGPSEYDLKRMKAADEANAALGNVAAGYQAAAMSGNIAQVLAALQGGGGGAAGNSVRTELVLPSGLAAQIGLAGQQIGDQIVTQWSDVTLEQFQQVIAAMKENPELVNAIRGSGDVPYLSGADAQAIAEQIAQGAQGLLNAFVAMEKVRDKIRSVTDKITEAARDVLPPELADHVASGVATFRDRMLAVMSAGLPVEEMQKQLEALGKELDQYVGMVALYGTLEQEIAQFSGDLATQTRGAILGVRTILDGVNQAVEDARSRAAEAVTPEEVLTANAALREAVLNRYKTEVELVTQIQNKIGSLLENIGKPAAAMQAGAAAELLRQGDAAPFNAIYSSLVRMAQDAPTIAQRLFAIGQGIGTVLAALPATTEFLTNGYEIYGPNGPRPANGQPGGAATVPDQIVETLATQVAPFFTELGEMLETARANGDLEGQLSVLQTQAQLIQQVAAAAIQAVQDWARAAVEETNRAAEAMAADIRANYTQYREDITNEADAKIKGFEEERDRQLAVNQAIIDGNTLTIEGNNLRIKGLRAEAAALQEQLQIAQQWRSAMEVSKDFTQGLLLGAGSPLDRDAQLALVQGNYSAALTAYREGPTAEGLGEIQRAAQTMLQQQGQYLGTNSSEYAASVSQVLADLEAARALAPKDTVDTLQAQLEGINRQVESLEAANEALQQTNKELSDLNEKIKADAKVNIDWWEAWKKDKLDEADRNEARDLDLVAKWKQAQLDAIAETAATTIDNIKKGTAQALLENAAAQNAIMNQLIVSQLDTLKEITGGMPVQDFIAKKQAEAVVALEAIKANLEAFLARMPAAAGGMAYVRQTMPIVVHEGERILRPEEREAYEEMEAGYVPRPVAGPSYRLPRARRAAASDDGLTTVVIEKLHIENRIDGEKAGDVVIDRINAKARRGKRPLRGDAFHEVTR